MTQRSRLHVPVPPARPGDKPDFSYLQTSAAGAAPRPEPLAAAKDTFALSGQLIRVLDPEHRAVGPWDPHLPPQTLRQALQHMVLTRRFDDRMQRMHRQGRISFYVRCTGEEAVSVGGALALAPGDMLFPHYRNQGLQIVRGHSLVDLMCQCLSNSRDMCKGRQLPVMYHWTRGRMFSISGNLATQFPQAVGWAMAAALKGEEHIAASWIGEGSSAEADFHHAMTFAAVYQAPVILNVVNNQWAISSFQGLAGGEQSTFAQRGPGYGMPGLRVDGNDLLAVYAATRWAAQRARSQGGPTLIEHVTYRAAAHSTSDEPSRYRPREEPEAWPLGDPVERLQSHLIALGEWSTERQKKLEQELDAQVSASWREAVSYGDGQNEGPALDPLTMFEDVFKEMPQHLVRQQEELRGLLEARSPSPAPPAPSTPAPTPTPTPAPTPALAAAPRKGAPGGRSAQKRLSPKDR